MKDTTTKRRGLLAVCAVLLTGALVLAGCDGPSGGGGGGGDDTGVTVTAAAASVAKGGTLQFSASIHGSSTTAVTWSITTSGTASGTSINANGLLTVDAAETESSIEVKATSTADTSKFGTKTVSVTTTGGENPGGGSNNYYGEYYPNVSGDGERGHIYIFFDDKEITFFMIERLTGFSVTVGGVQQTLSVGPGYPDYPWVAAKGSNSHMIGIWFDNDLPATGDIKVSYDGSNSAVTAKGVPIFTDVAVERK